MFVGVAPRRPLRFEWLVHNGLLFKIYGAFVIAPFFLFIWETRLLAGILE